MQPEKTIFKTMEQDKTQEGQLRKVETGNLFRHDHKYDPRIWERINAKSENSKEVFNSQTESNIKKNQTKLKSTII